MKSLFFYFSIFNNNMHATNIAIKQKKNPNKLFLLKACQEYDLEKRVIYIFTTSKNWRSIRRDHFFLFPIFVTMYIYAQL